MRSSWTLPVAAAAVVAGAALVGPAGLAQADSGLGPVEQISAPGIASGDPVAVAGTGGNAWVAFTSRSTNQSVQVAQRRGGVGWSAPVVLSTPGIDASDPVLAGNASGTACVAWTEDSWAQSRVAVACHDGNALANSPEWSASTFLGPLSARVDSLALHVDDDGNAVLAMVGVSPDLASAGLHVATRDDGVWSSTTTVDHVRSNNDSLRDPQVVRAASGRAAVLWLRNESLVVSLRGADAMWGASEIAHAGAVDTAALSAAGGGIIAAWHADAQLWSADLTDVSSPPRRMPTDAVVDHLWVGATDEGDSVMVTVDEGGALRVHATTSDDSSAPVAVLASAVQRLWLEATDDGVQLAVESSDGGMEFIRVRFSPVPVVTERLTVELPDVAAHAVAIADPRSLIVWVSDGSPEEVRAARTSATRTDSSPSRPTPLTLADRLGGLR